MRYTFFSLLLLSSCIAYSQANDSLRLKYDRQFITRYGKNFMMDNQKLSFRDLHPEFDNTSLGLEFYRRAKRQRGISQILGIVSLAATVGVIGSIGNNRSNNNAAYLFAGGQLLTSLLSAGFYQRSITETDRALQIRNRELLFPGR